MLFSIAPLQGSCIGRLQCPLPQDREPSIHVVDKLTLVPSSPVVVEGRRFVSLARAPRSTLLLGLFIQQPNNSLPTTTPATTASTPRNYCSTATATATAVPLKPHVPCVCARPRVPTDLDPAIVGSATSGRSRPRQPDLPAPPFQVLIFVNEPLELSASRGVSK